MNDDEKKLAALLVENENFRWVRGGVSECGCTYLGRHGDGRHQWARPLGEIDEYYSRPVFDCWDNDLHKFVPDLSEPGTLGMLNEIAIKLYGGVDAVVSAVTDNNLPCSWACRPFDNPAPALGATQASALANCILGYYYVADEGRRYV